MREQLSPQDRTLLANKVYVVHYSEAKLGDKKVADLIEKLPKYCHGFLSGFYWVGGE